MTMPSRSLRHGVIGAALVLGAVAAAHADDIFEANVKLIGPGEQVTVARIPEGVYLRSVNDPDDILWERLPEYRVEVGPAPPFHQSISLRYDEDAPRRNLNFHVARTDERFYVRLRWRDTTRDTDTLKNRFRDGAAVQFPIGDDTTSVVMGTDAGQPVNIWYWHPEGDAVESLAAGGPGSTTHLPDQPVTGQSLYLARQTEAANEWVVVMSRPISANGDFQVALDRDVVPMAFAVWQGSTGERDGHKSVSDDWIMLDMNAE